MKKSEAVSTVLIAGVVLFGISHHNAVQRDLYPNKEACQKDWGNDARNCEAASGHGAGRYFGPSYEKGSRPLTNASYLAEQTVQVKRSGFGRSGARFSGGG